MNLQRIHPPGIWSRFTIIFIVLYFFISPVTAAQTTDPWEQLFGPADVSAVSGNGGLTIGVNSFGRLTSCRWPSPGGNDQLGYRAFSRDLPNLGVRPEDGAQWAFQTDQGLFWLTGPPWQTEQHYASDVSSEIITVSQLPDTPVVATQQLFACTERDVLVWRVHLAGLKTPPRIYWFANFTPCTRQLPELPITDWLLDPLNDFSVFADPENQAIYHFRPDNPSSSDWERARQLAARKAPPQEWYAFGEGIWIGYAGLTPLRAFQCSVDLSPDAPLSQIKSGHLSGTPSAVGQCQSAIELEPRQDQYGYTAEVVAAFGKNRDHVDTALKFARERGYDPLRRNMEIHWSAFLEEASLDGAGESDLGRRRALLIIAQSMDRETGAIVRAPITQPPRAMDSARDGAWMTLALDLAGLHALAEQHLRFYLPAIRSVSKASAPKGSLPMASCANHTEAVPGVILETGEAAWWLSSVWKHAQLLPPEHRLSLLTSLWKDILPVSRFLSEWTQPVAGAPLPTFQSDTCRDSRQILSILHAYMGMTAASNIAQTLNKDESGDWITNARDLEAQIQFHCLNYPEPLNIPPHFAYWLDGIVPRDEQNPWEIWDVEIQAGGLCAPLREVTFPCDDFLNDPAPTPFPDTWRAAMRFIAATLKLYGESPGSSVFDRGILDLGNAVNRRVQR
ncbi:MAG TPA: hypothetical protein PLI09_11700 [Candidatus Hydrogenedentes bacterium]|nr:hypothetical protein [Candidatus Hydrogenedentota bacterium]